MNKAIFTLIIGLFLLDYVGDLPYKPFSRKSKKGKIEKQISKIARKFKKSAHNKVYAKLIVSMIFGYKRGLPKDIKKKFQILNLLHLFTPSGLHFSSLFIFLLPLFNLSRYCHPRIPRLIVILFCLLPFFLEKFYSLKRIALLKILTVIFGKRFSIFTLFLMTFALDFIFGSFQQSPLSFVYSFIFLGTLLSFKKINFKLLLGLFTGQLILAMFLKQEINLLGPFMGFFMTSLFTFLFPVLLVSFVFFNVIGTLPAEFLLKLFLKLIDLCIQISTLMPECKINFAIIIIMLLILSNWDVRVKSKLIFLGMVMFY